MPQVLVDSPDHQLAKLPMRSDEHIRVRVYSQLYDRTRGARGAFVGWQGVSWRCTLVGREAALEWRDTIDLFFSVLGSVGTQRMQDALLALAKPSQVLEPISR